MNDPKPGESAYTVTRPSDGEEVQMRADQLEQVLLRQLEDAGEDSVDAMWELAQFYKVEGKLDLAMASFKALLKRVEDSATQAKIAMALGQTAEKYRDFALAETFYRQALALDSDDPVTRYFVRNNLGYSLNQLGQFAEGESYCRQAIEIDAGRANGHKNLGLALQGQGRIREAADAFVAATLADVFDGRAALHLSDLIPKHPEMRDELAAKLRQCRRAHAAARG